MPMPARLELSPSKVMTSVVASAPKEAPTRRGGDSPSYWKSSGLAVRPMPAEKVRPLSATRTGDPPAFETPTGVTHVTAVSLT